MAAGSGTVRTVGLHVRRGDVQEGEAAVPVASNPSSPICPDLAHNPGPARDAVSGPFYMHIHVWPNRLQLERYYWMQVQNAGAT